MTRPVRPTALVILTGCLVYPGVTMLFQGLYPLVTGEWFSLVGNHGPWANVLTRFGVPQLAVDLVKALIGAGWVAGVLGLWAGDGKAWPLAVGAAAVTLLAGGGPTVMAVVALVCLFFFRENADEVPA